MAYLLDANVFISAKNLHYGLDFCPAFWDWIIANNASGGVFSTEKAGDEVLALETSCRNGPTPAAPVSFSGPTQMFSLRWRQSAPGRVGNATSPLRSAPKTAVAARETIGFSSARPIRVWEVGKKRAMPGCLHSFAPKADSL